MRATAVAVHQRVRVLICDTTRMGSQLLGEALRRERRFKVVGFAASWDELQSLLSERPEVIVLAANFEKQSGGMEAAALIAAQASAAAIVILIDHADDRELIVEAFRAGAKGVFSRSRSLAEMCKCIECLAEGQTWASGEQMGYVLEALQRSVLPRFVNAEGLEMLSEREQQVVRYVCDGLTNRDIAHAMGLSEHTVKNHLFRVYAKLGVDKRVEVMFSVLGRTPAAEFCQLESKLPAGSDAEHFRQYLQWSERSLAAQYMLGKMCQDGRGTKRDSAEAYAWLLRSERGATELISKCRAIRELLGNHLTPEQRKQAESRAAQPRRGKLGISPVRKPEREGERQFAPINKQDF